MRIILASLSPRRKELLSKIIDDFEIIPSNIDESKYDKEEVAYQKAIKIAELNKDALIISADTIVVLDEVILGKPHDSKHAKEMLNILSNKTHEVITYYCIYNSSLNININKKVVTKVCFNKLDEDLIERYVATSSPLDKAGAYGIQDKEFDLVKYIIGEEDNVIGFPIIEIKKDLEELGIKTK